MPVRSVVLVRHAETAWSIARRHTGRTNLPLTDDGREAARALRPRLAERSFALVLSSPLSRAADTAQLAGLDAAEPEPDLQEWDYGEYEGITTKEIRETRPDWVLWRDGCPGGESADDVGARVDRVIARVLDVEGDACLVAHSHLLRVLAARWLEQPAAFGARLVLETGSLSELAWERETRVLAGWNA
jgi:probable phosphoglycerate mutase